jgi:hypothetical protein
VNDNDQDSAAPTARLNYFNYFTEVEEEFVRRRGKSLLVSPMDWALIESWKSAGIPLHLVLRAINLAFDAYDARNRKYRRVNSVFYCQQEVEAIYAEYRLSQVGSDPKQSETRQQQTPSRGRDPAFSAEVLLDFFSRSDRELARAESQAEANRLDELRDVLARAKERLSQIAEEVARTASPDAEAIEFDLDGIDRMIVEAIKREVGQETIDELDREARSLLQPYKKKMDKGVYEQTVNNFISRRLREINDVPRLSLFYL